MISNTDILLYKKKDAPFAQNITDMSIDNPVFDNHIDIEDASAIVKQGETKCLKCCKMFKYIKMHLHRSAECKSFYDSNTHDLDGRENICSDREPNGHGHGLLNECKSCKKKSRIRETSNLSTDADNRTDTIFFSKKFFLKKFIFKKKIFPQIFFPTKFFSRNFF